MPVYGFGTVNNGTANVSASSGTIIAANASRKYLVLSNFGTVDVSIRLGTAAAVSGEGIIIPIDGKHEMAMGLGNVWSGAITGIVASGSAKVAYTEGQ